MVVGLSRTPGRGDTAPVAAQGGCCGRSGDLSWSTERARQLCSAATGGRSRRVTTSSSTARQPTGVNRCSTGSASPSRSTPWPGRCGSARIAATDPREAPPAQRVPPGNAADFGTVSGWWQRQGRSGAAAARRPRRGEHPSVRRLRWRLRLRGPEPYRGSPGLLGIWWGMRGCRRRSRTLRYSSMPSGRRGVGGCSPITRRGRGRTGRSWWLRWIRCGRGTRWWCGGWTGWAGRCRI